MDAPGETDKSGSPPARVSASEASKSFGEMLRRVEVGKERIVITRHGYPAAELVPMTAAA